MATYHTCDICGKELPDDPKEQAYVSIGSRQVIKELLYYSSTSFQKLPGTLEAHIECANEVAEYINVKRNFNGLEDLHMGD